MMVVLVLFSACAVLIGRKWLAQALVDQS
jgi:hypothetical protein